MIVDSSAILSILYNEPDAKIYSQAFKDANMCRISAATLVEVSIVADGQRIGDKLDDLIKTARIVVEPLTEEQARIAREAYREYGRGNHKAKLNFGDCFAYALAMDVGEPLLFKGEDFAHTDVESALAA